MTRTLRVVAVQEQPIAAGAPSAVFAADVRRVVQGVDSCRLVVYPELHLFGSEHLPYADRDAFLRASAVPLESELVRQLGELAAELGVWLIPGSICERDGERVHNTLLVFAPDGTLRARYRKVFPWRPYEPYDPGDRFVVVDLDGIGRIGLSICYDAWFPEVSRHLAWMGAEAVVNIVKTTTPDRAQELVLARANSIANQTFTVSLNCAGPIGKGRSIVVDPEGGVIEETGTGPALIVVDLDLDEVIRVHETGTVGLNRVWAQFRPDDAPLALPLYDGRIEPARWRVGGAD